MTAGPGGAFVQLVAGGATLTAGGQEFRHRAFHAVSGPITVAAIQGCLGTTANVNLVQDGASGTWATDTYIGFKFRVDQDIPAHSIVRNQVYEYSVGYGSLADPAAFAGDTTPPAVVLSSNVIGTAVGGVVSSDDTLEVTMTLSEDGALQDASKITISGGTLGTVSGSGKVFKVIATPAANQPAGTILNVSVGAGAFKDLAGNLSTAPSTGGVTQSIDTEAPTATLSALVLDSVGTYKTTVTTSEPTSTLDFADLIFPPGTLTFNSPTNPGTVFEYFITPANGGPFSVSLPANAFTDAAGNPSVASNVVGAVADKTSPTVTLGALTKQSNGTYTSDITLSETPASGTAFELSDLSLTNATATLSGSGTSFIATLTPAADGVIKVSVPANAFTDASRNSSTAGAEVSTTVDTTAPTVVVSGGPTSITGPQVFDVNVVFNESVTGFTASDVTVSGGAATAVSGSGTTYTATISATGSGGVDISIPAGAASDGSANGNGASNVLSIGNNIAALTQERNVEAALSRSNALVQNQPGLTSLMTGGRSGGFSANVTRGNGSFDVSNARKGPIWFQATGSWSTSGNTNSKYAFGALGSHVDVSENLIVGGQVQLDFDQSDNGTSRHESKGWMIGPYFVAKVPEQPLYFEGALLYGQASHDVSPIGTYTDTFSSDTLMANFKLTGEIEKEAFTLQPSFGFNYVTDQGEAYTDSLNNAIAGYTTELGQASMGMNAIIPLDVTNGQMDLLLGGSLLYGFSSVTGTANVSSVFEGGRGRVDAGFAWRGENDNDFGLKLFYDGIGSSAYEGYGADLNYSIRF